MEAFIKKQALRVFNKRKFKLILQDYELILFVLPAVVIVYMFCYVPMYGAQIAFRDYTVSKGISGSPWVGLDHFIRFFNTYRAGRIILNTLILNLYSLILGFPTPIIFALALNQIRNERFKSLAQTVTYLPHFISTVVMVGMIMIFLTPDTGIFTHLSRLLGGSAPRNPLATPKYFRMIYVVSDIWQHTGWNSILYLAALANIDVNLYDAAKVDGASRLQRIIHIDLPCIVPTVVLLLILSVGGIMSIGFEKIFLLQNDLNLPVSDVLPTYIYSVGILGARYSYTAAVGMFTNIVNFSLLVIVNQVSKSIGSSSLW